MCSHHTIIPQEYQSDYEVSSNNSSIISHAKNNINDSHILNCVLINGSQICQIISNTQFQHTQ